MAIEVIHGDMLTALPMLGTRFHAIVTDPPYELTFMGSKWDSTGVAFRPETWRAVYDVMLPGAYLVACGGTRTWHRMACAIEDAGFELRDTICWLYGSGFPKSHDAERAVAMDLCELPGHHYGRTLPPPDKRKPDDHICPECVESIVWDGWGTALKPAFEPIILARKPLQGTVAQNVLAHGCGALNIDASRVAGDVPSKPQPAFNSPTGKIYGFKAGEGRNGEMSSAPNGRWPANVLHDGSAEVEAAFAAFGERTSGTVTRDIEGSTGAASRFFYSAKADAGDRADSRHPTVKPVDLMRYLVRLVIPPGGRVLDPFAGSGTTGEACMLLGLDCTLIERDEQHYRDILHRQKRWSGEDLPLFQEAAQ
jgi:hypothetical protein